MRSHQLEEVRKQSLSLFYTDQDAEVIAKDLQVHVKTLHRWWVAVFGKEAVRQRGRTRNIVSNQRRGLPEWQTRLCKCGQACTPGYYVCLACHSERNKHNRSNMSPETRLLNSVREKGYKALHADIYRAHRITYTKEHSQEISAKSRAYHSKYPEKRLLLYAKQRAKEHDLPFKITAEYIKSCIPVDGCCPITTQPFERGVGSVGSRSMTLDRIIPEIGYVVGKVSVISHLANLIKTNCTDPTVFRQVADYVELVNGRKITHPIKIGSCCIEYGRSMLKRAKDRAKRHSLPFSITLSDIRSCFPEDGCCPITRQPFKQGDGKVGPYSMSLDRTIPELGYVPGNIAVISHLANTIKQNCTDPEVFRRIADYLERAQEPVLKKAG